MGSVQQFNPYPVVTDGAMSADIISKVTIVQKLSLISYSTSWTGTSPVGVVNIEVSNDYSQNVDGTVNNPGTWTALTLSVTPAVSGNTGNGFIDVRLTGAYAMRLHYVRTSGTGVMQAIVSAKVS